MLYILSPWKWSGLALMLWLPWLLPGCTCGGRDKAGATDAPAATHRPVRLNHLGTVKRLPPGTHRPELLTTHDGGFALAVVQPEGSSGPGQVKHQLHRFDDSWHGLGAATPLTRNDPVLGEPADHRAVLVRDELVLIYQTLNWRNGHPPEGRGPAEDQARDQSLVLARFDLAGKELFRRVLVDRGSDARRENFPDHSVLWTGDALLVSSGSRASEVILRRVTLQGQVLSRRALACSPGSVPWPMGNGLALRGGKPVIFSSSGMGPRGMLTMTELGAKSGTPQLARFPHPERSRIFPAAVAQVRDLIVVAHISASTADPPPAGLKHNFSARLLLLSPSLQVVGDVLVGKGGHGHVHPTVAVRGDRLLVAWSKREIHGQALVPRVQVEAFRLE